MQSIERAKRIQNMTIDCQRSIDNNKLNKRYSDYKDAHFETNTKFNSITHDQRKLSQIITGQEKNMYTIGQNPSVSVDRSELGIMRDCFGKSEKIILPKQRTIFTNKDAMFRKSLQNGALVANTIGRLEHGQNLTFLPDIHPRVTDHVLTG